MLLYVESSFSVTNGEKSLKSLSQFVGFLPDRALLDMIRFYITNL